MKHPHLPADSYGRVVNTRPHVDVARVVLGAAALLLLVCGSLFILSPFLLALVWGATIVTATWPVLLSVQHRLHGHRGPAVAVMLFSLLIVIVLPCYGALATLSAHTADIMTFVKGLPTFALPPPPHWLATIPVLGSRAAKEWQTLSDAGPGGILATLQPYAKSTALWLLAHMGSIGSVMLHLMLTLVICGLLYAKGEVAALTTTRLARRVAPDNGEAIVRLVGLSIRAVALGVVVTALVQASLAGLGLWIAGVPFAGILTALLFILCLAQIGPLLPLLGSVAWLFTHEAQVAAILLLVWAIFVSTIDNFLRPVLIRRAVALPLVLILVGVIGGLIAFGIVGLFIGPVILAVTYALMQAWLADGEAELRPASARATPVGGDEAICPTDSSVRAFKASGAHQSEK